MAMIGRLYKQRTKSITMWGANTIIAKDQKKNYVETISMNHTPGNDKLDIKKKNKAPYTPEKVRLFNYMKKMYF